MLFVLVTVMLVPSVCLADAVPTTADVAVVPVTTGLDAAASGEAMPAEKPFKWSPVTFETFRNAVFLTAELHGSFINDVEDRATIGDSFGYDIKAGWRWKNLGVFFQFEHNLWVTSELEMGVKQGAVNLGIGLEVNYLHGYVRTSIAAGPSILLFNTAVDRAGSVGLFIDLRPIGLRWPIKRYFAITFDPMSFAMVAPALDRVPLLMIQFRTTLGFEFAFK
jgi:hypothetical protein